jgi:hypothetical protein
MQGHAPLRWVLCRALCFAALASIGCGGGAPLLHPAHVLKPGDATIGAGMSGQFALVPRSPAPQGDKSASRLEELTVAAGVAPWVAGRVGIDGDNEAGLTYTARTVRIDARHAFALGVPTLSIGLGASAILADRPESGTGSSVYGGGADLPILLGITSKSDVYSLWIGPRAGVELLSGRLDTTELTSAPVQQELIDARARHFYVGGVLGMRVGFRHVHVGLELGAAYHHASATFGDASLSINQATLTPAGALLISF